MVSPQKHRSSWPSEQASHAWRGDGLAKVLVLYCNSLQCTVVNLFLSTGSTSPWLTEGNKEEKRCSAQAAAAWQRPTVWWSGWRKTTWRVVSDNLVVRWRLFEQLSYPSVLSALMDGQHKSPKRRMKNNTDDIGRPQKTIWRIFSF